MVQGVKMGARTEQGLGRSRKIAVSVDLQQRGKGKVNGEAGKAPVKQKERKMRTMGSNDNELQ
jgi:hypothetical protein